MLDDELLERIHQQPWIAELLADFDFDIARVANGPVEEVHLVNGEPLEMIAGDAAGGAFMRAGAQDAAQWPIVYVGSEGEGGLIAMSLRDTLGIIVGVPSLHDALELSYDGGGARLRAWLAENDVYVRGIWPEIDTARVRVREALDLPAADDLLEALHLAAADDRFRPIGEGGPYSSMLRGG